MSWLPEGKRAAVCFSIDDVHPSGSADGFDAGGDLSSGALGFVERLLERFPFLRVTLFVTPDWRPAQLVRSRLAARVPILCERLYHVQLHEKGRFRVDRYPEFVRYLNGLPRTDVAPHGLHHVHRGSNLAVEFQEQDRRECSNAVCRSLEIFDSAGLEYEMGFAPPGWNLPLPLTEALDESCFAFVASARDIRSAISPDAKNSMSGLKGVSLIFPEQIGRGGLVHVPTNFQATSVRSRADQIIGCNGLLSIKAHIFKQGGGYVLADGLDENYYLYLDSLFAYLDRRYGESLWWTSMSEAAAAGSVPTRRGVATATK